MVTKGTFVVFLVALIVGGGSEWLLMRYVAGWSYPLMPGVMFPLGLGLILYSRRTKEQESPPGPQPGNGPPPSIAA